MDLTRKRRARGRKILIANSENGAPAIPPLGALFGGGQYWGFSRLYLKRGVLHLTHVFTMPPPFQPSLHVLDLLVLSVDDVSQESWHVQGLVVETLRRLSVLQCNSERYN